MIVVIQCAGSKQPNAGQLRTRDGRPVWFVAHPEFAPADDDRHYARPDDASDQGGSWRDHLVSYNASPGANPLGLLPAFELYRNGVYRALVGRFGLESIFILSAGWGLINAGFLTPNYDITFSASAPKHLRRRRDDCYRDFTGVPRDVEAPVLFFGGKDYVPLFVALTQDMKSRRIVFYRTAVPPAAPGCVLKRYETRTQTNWHYECAAAFIRGDVGCD